MSLHKFARILQGNPLPLEGIHIIIPLAKFEEHVFILRHVSCPEKCADNQAQILCQTSPKTLYPRITALVPVFV